MRFRPFTTIICLCPITGPMKLCVFYKTSLPGSWGDPFIVVLAIRRSQGPSKAKIVRCGSISSILACPCHVRLVGNLGNAGCPVFAIRLWLHANESGPWPDSTQLKRPAFARTGEIFFADFRDRVCDLRLCALGYFHDRQAGVRAHEAEQAQRIFQGRRALFAE
jgi:hypothetical protein